MKHFIKSIVIFSVTMLFFSACEEDEFADWKILNKQWFEQYSQEQLKEDPNFHQTESGLCYRVVHNGIMGYPNVNSYVIIEYTGWLIDQFPNGTPFESKTISQYLPNSIPAFQEGLLKMRVGSQYWFYIPADLGYGKNGTTDIPPHSTLIFKVILKSVY